MNFIELIRQTGTENGIYKMGFLFIVIIGLFFIGKIIKYIVHKISRKRLLAEKPLYAAFLEAISKSATLLLICLGIVFCFYFLNFPAEFNSIINTTQSVLITLSIGLFLYNLTEVPGIWFENLTEKSESELNKLFFPVIKKSLRVVVIIFVLLQIIQILSDKPITSIIAGLGIGGLAVALAAQDTIKHFIGSFVIVGDKPFKIGERVVIDGHDGMIETIGLRSTQIRNFDGHIISIPNGELANKTIQNIGKRPYIKRAANITVTYDTPPEKVQRAIDIIKGLLDKHEGMNPDFPPRVFFDEFNSDSLNIKMIYWYHPALYWDYVAFTEKINFAILNKFNEEGIEFAFPTQTLYLAGDPKRPLKV
ncbi:MAG: mechanosensitive ion channel family protein [Salinivirgaceae bacterium]|nr:mechanosensitive ion channel family protein [Salinivirgaceae bacterium]